jgi:Winged helix DNA-binding domain
MSSKIAWARLHCQRLAAGRLARPEEVVGWLGAVQAQEYHLTKWGLALRSRRASDASIEQAFAAGRILRTHVMRSTWHFVTPADIRWLLALTAPRVRAAVAWYDRQLGITPAVITRANRALASALAGGAQLTRAELKAVLTGAGVRVDGTQRLAHVIMHAELDAVICSGARRGKQFTYALLDDRATVASLPTREDALAELARRYFTSHGPAQLKDFTWWSGLTSAEARTAVELSRQRLAEEEIGGTRYWLAPSARTLAQPNRAAYLLPPYDEFLIAYKDRSASLDPLFWKSGAGRGPYAAPVVLDGRVVGGWRPAPSRDGVAITFDLPRRLDNVDAGLVEEAARRYGDFLGENLAITSR